MERKRGKKKRVVVVERGVFKEGGWDGCSRFESDLVLCFYFFFVVVYYLCRWRINFCVKKGRGGGGMRRHNMGGLWWCVCVFCVVN